MVNEQIRDKEVRVVDSDGKMLGIMPIKEAQKLANSKNLDLVKVAPKANPPVCKIMDYGKYMFEQAKREKEAKKKQKTINLKEVWMKPKIEEHDFSFKTKHAQRFLKEGNKVKVGIKFRGREMNYTVLGKEVLERFAKTVADLGEVEKEPRMEGRNMVMILNPKN